MHFRRFMICSYFVPCCTIYCIRTVDVGSFLTDSNFADHPTKHSQKKQWPRAHTVNQTIHFWKAYVIFSVRFSFQPFLGGSSKGMLCASTSISQFQFLRFALRFHFVCVVVVLVIVVDTITQTVARKKNKKSMEKTARTVFSFRRFLHQCQIIK